MMTLTQLNNKLSPSQSAGTKIRGQTPYVPVFIGVSVKGIQLREAESLFFPANPSMHYISFGLTEFLRPHLLTR